MSNPVEFLRTHGYLDAAAVLQSVGGGEQYDRKAILDRARDSLQEIRDDIVYGFTWTLSPQGDGVWRGFASTLKNLIEAVEAARELEDDRTQGQ